MTGALSTNEAAESPNDTQAKRSTHATEWDLRYATETLRLIDRKWTLPVLRALWTGPRRFQSLHRALQVQPKVLSESLRQLERDGLVERGLGSDPSRPVLYALTPLAQSLTPLLHALVGWAASHHDDLDASRRHWDRNLEAVTPPVTST